MPSPGLSLVGFLDQQSAIGVLRRSCVFPDLSDAALAREWQRAVDKLGAPVQNAGQPDIQPIPADGQAYMEQLLQQPWVAKALREDLMGATFQMVELDPLLAFQFDVNTARSHHHTAGAASGPPSTEELFNICLPRDLRMENVRVNTTSHSLLVTSQGLNFLPLAKGIFRTACGSFVGIEVAPSGPFMYVAKYNGRYFLHNGFNRAVGLRRRGVTHAPCVVRDEATPQAVGILPGSTFELALLESANPPTIRHFTENRALDVQLKVFSRTLHVSWSDYVTTLD
jgi:hypothetical protein